MEQQINLKGRKYSLYQELGLIIILILQTRTLQTAKQWCDQNDPIIQSSCAALTPWSASFWQSFAAVHPVLWVVFNNIPDFSH